MIDFSKITGITLPPPPGDVATATITLTGTTTGSYAEYKGTRYTDPSTFEAAVGDEISMHVGDGPSVAAIYLDGQQVATGQSKADYSYAVVSNATFAYSTTGSGATMQIRVHITETPFTGVVTQITDASGRVLWSAKPSTAKVTVIGDYVDNGYARTSAGYITPDGVSGFLGTAGEYELPIGTVIYCFAEANEKASTRPSVSIYLNGEWVDGSDSNVNYQHTLATNLAIEHYNNAYNGASIYITEQ